MSEKDEIAQEIVELIKEKELTFFQAVEVLEAARVQIEKCKII